MTQENKVPKLGRIDCLHYCGEGTQLLVDRLEDLTDAERLELPKATVELFINWPELVRQIPEELSWAKEEFHARRRPVLERSEFTDRIYWSVRFPRRLDQSSLQQACLGATGIILHNNDIKIKSIRWLMDMGTMNLVSEQSGSAPWGHPFSTFSKVHWWFSPDGQSKNAIFPPESKNWFALYEIDGDAIFADPTSGKAFWVGSEWTGRPLTQISDDWRSVAIFVLWSLIKNVPVRPSDLEMLHTTRRICSL